MGFDFWTTNSTIWVVEDWKNIKMINLWSGKIDTRTVLYYNPQNNNFIAGDNWIDAFKKDPTGRLFQSPKSWLNTEKEIETLLRPGKSIKLTNIVEEIIKSFKHSTECQVNNTIKKVVVGRPVKFHDTDIHLDKLAQDRLELALRNMWFSEIIFELEPNAALKNYLITSPNPSNTVVVDIGWWTADFSVVKIKKNENSEILSNWGVYIWWNKLDIDLSNWYFSDFLWRRTTYRTYDKDLEIPGSYYSMLSDWKNLHNLSSHKNARSIKGYFTFANEPEKVKRLLEISQDFNKGYKYLNMVEQTKKNLTFNDQADGEADFFTTPFQYVLWREQFNTLIKKDINIIKDKLIETIKESWLKPNDISNILYTWGTSLIPYIQEEIAKILSPNAKKISSDAINSVGYWLTVLAKEYFF